MGNVLSQSCAGIPSVWLILNTRSLHSIRVLSKPRGFWPELNQVLALQYLPFMQETPVNAKQKAVEPQQESGLNERRVWACAPKISELAHAHCGVFPKHWGTCALNTESSGAVCLQATSHRFQITSNSSTTSWCDILVKNRNHNSKYFIHLLENLRLRGFQSECTVCWFNACAVSLLDCITQHFVFSF